MARILRLALLVVGSSLLSGVPAAASTGVSIDVGSIAISEHLSPGGQYRLPTFGVRNPGTDETAYVLVVGHVDGQPTLRPQEGWFTFDPAELTLAGGASRAVQTTLAIPADAEPGTYEALIGPRIVGQGGGAQIGAGAAARLTFTVEPSSALDASLRQIWRFLTENPWVWIAALVIALLAVVVILRRRFQFNVTRRG